MKISLRLPLAKSGMRSGKGASNNSRQHVIRKMPQGLTVGSESLATGFATGNNYTRAAEGNRRLPVDERA